MATTSLPLETVETNELTVSDTPWVTIVWNDPINLMSYVSYVLQSYFSYSKTKSEKLMLQIHNEGKATVSFGSKEAMERDTQAMHSFGLWASYKKQ